MRKTTVLMLFACGPLALLGAGVAAGHGGHEELPKGGKVEPGGIVRLDADARASLGLKTAPVEERTFDETLTLNGRALSRWDARAFATSRVAGRVVDLSVKPWDHVEAGAVLATVESAELQDLGVELVQAGLRRALYEDARSREQALAAKGISAEKNVLEAETEFAKAKSAEETARAKLLAVGLDAATVAKIASDRAPVRTLAVRAPHAGLVHHVDVSPGELVEPTKHVFEIHDLATVWVEARVLEADARRVRLGQEALVRADGIAARGTVVHVALDADADRSVRAFVEVANADGALKENLPVRVEIVVSRSEDAVAIPRSAVVSLGVERFVLVEESEGVYKRRDLVIGKSDDAFVEALEGLYLGDRVVTSGQHELGSFFQQGELQISAAARRRLGVADDEVELGAIAQVAQVVGTVRLPTGRAGPATARVPGKVARLVGQPGQRVKKGEVVAEIESLELVALELDLVEADLELSLKQKDLERVRTLASQDIQPRAELFRLETEFQAKEAGVSALARRLRLLGVGDDEIARIRATHRTLETLGVRAPIDGVLSLPRVVLGEVVALGSVLYDVEDTATVWVEGAAYPSDVARLRVGQLVRVRVPALPDEALEGRVAFLGSVLDPQSRGLPVYVTVPNGDGRLKAGFQASLAVKVGATDELISAPLASVLSESTGPVTILAEGATYRRVPVRLGERRDDQRVEVISGLFPGDRLVTTGAEEVRSALLSVR